ncbi:MAG TPA: type II secretion system F family protein [Jatrophihabitantaceae bacterium]|nr:type II secretion system F family protein [Jatrophihabitantaceae bacterium]
MTAGLLLGALFASGLLIAICAAPPMRPIRLIDRVAPYLADAPAPSRLLAPPSTGSAPFVTVRRLLGPTLGDVVRAVDRMVGGTASVRRRLRGLNRGGTVEEFRIEQVIWSCAGLLAGVIVVGGAQSAAGALDPVLVTLGGLGGAIAGVFARDYELSRAVIRRERAVLAELPVVADLLALAVTAGEAPAEAIARVCRLTDGEIARDLDGALAHARTGTPVTTALTAAAERSTCEPFARFVSGIVVAIERGTPLADVLRAQAGDVREVSKRALLEAGGRKEISMMLPVVFLLLPVTVLFALYPGLVTLTTIAR